MPSAGDIVRASDVGGAPAWTAYTPTWTSSGTQPALGNGTLTGRFKRVGNTVHFVIQFSPGSTSTFGTGTYLFSLPANAVDAAHPGAMPALIFDTSVPVRRSAMATLNSVSNVLLVDSASTGAGIITNTVPWTWANGDVIRIAGTYEAAS